MATIMRRGDFIALTFEGRTVQCMVGLVSENHNSMLLLFDGVVDGCDDVMLVRWNEQDDRRWRNPITQHEVELVPVRRIPDGQMVQ